jgi:hypothetical protein
MPNHRVYEIAEACNAWEKVTFDDINDAKQYLTDRYGSTFTGKSAIKEDVIGCGEIGVWGLSSKLTEDAEGQV